MQVVSKLRLVLFGLSLIGGTALVADSGNDDILVYGDHVSPDSVKQTATQFNTLGMHALENSYSGDNLILSPLSLGLTLSLAQNAMDPVTKRVLLRRLGKKTSENANQAVFGLVKDLRVRHKLAQGETPTLVEKTMVANRFWSALSISEKFETTLKKWETNVPNSDGETSIGDLEIDQEDNNADLINQWAKKNTAGMIEKAIEAKDMKDVVVAFTNAYLFEAKFYSKFYSRFNKKELFTPEQGKAYEVEMMRGRNFDENPEGYNKRKYAENDKFKILRKEFKFNTKYKLDGEEPFDSVSVSRYAMDFILPKANSMGEFLQDFSAEDLRVAQSKLKTRGVQSWIPKFKLKTKTELKSLFKELNSAKIVEVESLNPVKVGVLNQTVAAELDEEGFKGAAVTVMTGVATSGVGELVQFRANRPFMFVVSDKLSGTILFHGIVAKP